MYPFIQVGEWRIETASALYALAMLMAGAFYLARLGRRRRQRGPAVRALLWIVVGGGLGANLGGALNLGYELLTGNPSPVPLKNVSFPGALIGGTAAAWLICRHYGLSFWWACDQGIPALPLGQAIGQLGCLARGCCYGRPTTSWLGMDLPNRQGEWATRYPTHLLCAAADVLTLVVLLAVAPALTREAGNRARAGLLTLLYLGLYLLQRFVIEFARGDALPVWIGPFNSTHLLCAAGLALVVGVAARKLWLGMAGARLSRAAEREEAGA